MKDLDNGMKNGVNNGKRKRFVCVCVCVSIPSRLAVNMNDLGNEMKNGVKR